MTIEEMLRLHEGERNLPYEDHLGNLTIGVGHNLDRPISQKAIDQILQDDIIEAVAELDRALPLWKGLNKTRQNVLIDMMFNLGAPRLLTFKKFIAALKAENYTEAAAEMLNSRWADQVGQRAETLAKMMWSDEA